MLFGDLDARCAGYQIDDRCAGCQVLTAQVARFVQKFQGHTVRVARLVIIVPDFQATLCRLPGLYRISKAHCAGFQVHQ